MFCRMYFFCIHNQQPSVFQLYAAENRVLYFLSFLCIPFYISSGPEARISPRCSIHVICKKEKIKRFFCEFLERWRKNKGICSRQQNATGVCRASRPASTPARLAAWTALQNYVLLFSQPCRQYTVTPNIPQQPASSPPASAGNNLSSSSFFFTEQISFFHQSIIFFPARPANTLTSSSFSIQGSSSFPHPTDFIPARPAKPSQASHLSLPGPQLSISQYTTPADR